VGASDVIAIIALVVSLFGILVSLLGIFFAHKSAHKSMKAQKYELSQEYREKILFWHCEIVEVFMRLLDLIDDPDSEDKKKLLLKLSFLVEKGRFYFPNYYDEKEVNWGADKPCAYRGFRDAILDLPVFFYKVCQFENSKDYREHLVWVQKWFTSEIYDILKPPHNLNHVREYSTAVHIQYPGIDDHLMTSFLSEKPGSSKSHRSYREYIESLIDRIGGNGWEIEEK